jgi:hypothetical protein
MRREAGVAAAYKTGKDTTVFSPNPADSDLRCTDELACHASKCGKDDVFSLTAGKRFVATGKMLSGEAPPTIMVKS